MNVIPTPRAGRRPGPGVAHRSLRLVLITLLTTLAAPRWAGAIRERDGHNAFFRPPVNISRTWGTSRLPRMNPRSLALDPEGPVLCAWVEFITHTTGTAQELALARFRVGSGWDSVYAAAGRWEGIPSTDPACVIDGGHVFHMVWLEQKPGAREVVGLRFDLRSGVTSEIETISEPERGAADPALAVDVDGHAHVVWSEIESGHPVLRYRQRGGGTWGPIESVPTTTGSAYCPDLASDVTGHLHLAWQQGLANGSAAMYARRSADGTWSAPEMVSEPQTGWYTGAPVVAAAEDRVWVVWAETDGRVGHVEARLRTGGVGGRAREHWSSALRPSSDKAVAEQPSAALDPWGTLHLLWLEKHEQGQKMLTAILYASLAPGDTAFAWPRPLTLEGTGPFDTPVVAADASGRVFAAWVDRGIERGDLKCRSGVAGFAALQGMLRYHP